MATYPKTFSHFGTSVSNLEASIAFYEAVMGWYTIMRPAVVTEESDSAVGNMCIEIFVTEWGSLKIAHLTFQRDSLSSCPDTMATGPTRYERIGKREAITIAQKLDTTVQPDMPMSTTGQRIHRFHPLIRRYRREIVKIAKAVKRQKNHENTYTHS